MGRGRIATLHDGELTELQLKRKQYYQTFRAKHADNPPEYHKKKGAKLGRPKKQENIDELIKECEKAYLHNMEPEEPKEASKVIPLEEPKPSAGAFFKAKVDEIINTLTELNKLIVV